VTQPGVPHGGGWRGGQAVAADRQTRAACAVSTKSKGRREADRWGPGNSSGRRLDLLWSSKFQTISN
jgi:hypothetical protein